jgi:hypothetical protein
MFAIHKQRASQISGYLARAKVNLKSIICDLTLVVNRHKETKAVKK